MENVKRHWLQCVVTGLAVLLISLYLMPKFPTDSAGIEPGYGSPVIAFEMARSVADLHAVFGTPDDPERDRRIAMMDDGNIWDFPFMIAYGLFIALFLRAAGTASGNSIWYLLAMLGIIAGAADAIENNILLGLTADIEGAPDIGLLAYPVWTKFLSIMITGVAAGVVIATQGRHFWRILGVVAAASALLTLPAFYDPSTYGALLTLGVTICWVIMLIFAITRWRQASA
ncbi:hypothetical protein BN1012_Phect237 [Candidatus Phaeomarinobacter ectocarpi]|uniref:Uncharacterized protein n=1 Tax=Candidatus Phaeomarinibacter ectocarpi TaxID=1458461 RepID=X5MLJ2_9HYPH|nr:hypothetical protein [Candidatus Phaeomarinobacter ectocarpi]CDO58451.1 hypothetical protein BN1012_Phect237 [Candidatus Phaeomarinobacter ectocarpi]